jgi:hypothetical protein
VWRIIGHTYLTKAARRLQAFVTTFWHSYIHSFAKSDIKQSNRRLNYPHQACIPTVCLCVIRVRKLNRSLNRNLQMPAVFLCFPRLCVLQTPLASFLVLPPSFACSVTHKVLLHVNPSMTLQFKFKRLPNKKGFLIYNIRKYIHDPTVHRGGQHVKN